MRIRHLIIAAAAVAAAGCASDNYGRGYSDAQYPSGEEAAVKGNPSYYSDHDQWGDPERAYYEDGQFPD